jgi:hypothetical protein
MNAWARFFFSEHGASRAYLFSKLFLLMLALDTWMLMIGHAGRYGVAGFNVAHFGWLDAIQPTPSAASYVAVLVLTGLLALVVVLTGVRRASVFALFVLYTFSWSMSMLDSYQHHYFLSLVLLCLTFFPQTSALELHPPAQPSDQGSKHERKQADQALARAERAGFLYATVLVAIAAAYATLDARGHTWVAFFLFVAALALATWFYSPASGHTPLLRCGSGFSLLGATVAIVYTFTAIAKMDAQWVAGHTIRQISAAEQAFAGLARFAERAGIDHERLWSLLASAVIPQELTIALLYLLAVHQDRLQSRVPRVLCALGFALAIVLHVGAEAMGLQIGWFSYYMLALACCFLLPLPIVDRLATVFSWPARFLTRRALEWEAESPRAPMPSLGLALGCALLLVLVGNMIDLPGAIAACVLAGVALMLVTLWLLRDPRAPDPRRYALATALASALMWLAIAASPVRWDFYRYLGGDLSRRGEDEAALEAYVRGERYAPPGESRIKQIRELRRKLAK